MDISELLREEWSTLVLIIFGTFGVFVALADSDWVWAATSGALVVSCIRILQLQGVLGVSDQG